MKKYYTVYQTTNLINGKIYIGIHATNNLEDGYLGSGRDIKQAIKEFGKDSFKKHILCIFDNLEEMVKKEEELVTDEFRNREDTYNCVVGGTGWRMLGAKLNPRSVEYRQKMSNAKKGFRLGSKHTIEVKEKISKKLKGRPCPTKGIKASEEAKKRMSESQKGRKHSEETIEKIRQINIGENNPNFGKKASKETREKMSNSQTGSKRSPRTQEHIEKLRQCNLGRKKGPHSDEHKEKLRLAKLGKSRSPEIFEKIRKTKVSKIVSGIIVALLNSKEN